jgi:hypothetical protein
MLAQGLHSSLAGLTCWGRSHGGRFENTLSSLYNEEDTAALCSCSRYCLTISAAYERKNQCSLIQLVSRCLPLHEGRHGTLCQKRPCNYIASKNRARMVECTCLNRWKNCSSLTCCSPNRLLMILPTSPKSLSDTNQTARYVWVTLVQASLDTESRSEAMLNPRQKRTIKHSISSSVIKRFDVRELLARRFQDLPSGLE